MRLFHTVDQRVLLREFVPGLVAEVGAAVIDGTWSAELVAAARADLAAADPSEGHLVLFTSGSTGRPRGVVRTVASWNDSQPDFSAWVPLDDDDVVWTPGPLWSGLFLWGAWHGVHHGARVVPHGEEPAAASVAFCAPAQAGAILGELAAGRLPRLRAVVLGGDGLGDRHRLALRERGVRVVEYYGAAELSLVAIADDAERGYRPLPGVRVRASGGRIEAATPYAALGYLRDDPTTPLTRDGDWLGVGDLGEVSPGGRLRVRGRGMSAVNVGGHTVVVEDVEQWLRSLDGVADAAVAGLDHPRLGQTLAAVVAGSRSVDELRAAARQLPRQARPRRWMLTGAVPRTPAGKLDRAAVATLLGAAGGRVPDLGGVRW